MKDSSEIIPGFGNKLLGELFRFHREEERGNSHDNEVLISAKKAQAMKPLL